MKTRYKNQQMQKCFDGALSLAADPRSEFYIAGRQHRGAAHRCAFWDGFNGVIKSANVVPNTLSWAFYQAGREWARRTRAGGQR